MSPIKTLFSAIFLLLLAQPITADAYVDCDGNGSVDLVCEGSSCQHQDGALGYCSCAVTPNGPGPVKSCMGASDVPTFGNRPTWQEVGVEASGQGEEPEMGETNAPEESRGVS